MAKVNLKSLIVGLSLLVMLIASVNGLVASYQTQRELLLQHALESNRVYATKQAYVAEGLVQALQQQLAFSATRVARVMDDPEQLAEETERLKQQSNSFDSVYVVRHDAWVLAGHPGDLVGRLMDSKGAREALSGRQPMISEPYVGITGVLLVFISHPIFAHDGEYLGYVGGSIYLNQENILHRLLGLHPYTDGSYLYVVDREGRLMFHQDAGRIGELVLNNPVIEAVRNGETGSRRLINSKGVDMLAGYAPVPSTGWGIVAQTPTAVPLEQLRSLTLQVIWRGAPVGLVCLLLIWWLARRIARPLEQLASSSAHWESSEAIGRIGRIRGGYREAERLKRAILSGLTLLHGRLGRLNVENVTDPLTGLFNRRGMQATLDAWMDQEEPFALIMLDIDHFKAVNDTFGHDVGDKVLGFLASKMRDNARDSDMLCRCGGEEFMILLPGADLGSAMQVAERLRRSCESTLSPTGAPIHLSAGVAAWLPGEEASALIKRADEALYEAKRGGRNRVQAAAQ